MANFALQVSLLFCGLSVAESFEVDCRKLKPCGDCIIRSPKCSWCEDTDYYVLGQPRRRCDLLKIHQQQNCKKIINPVSKSTAQLDDELNNDIKISPRNVSLHLRPGDKTTITINVLTPRNFPVDLYYLTDVSRSIKKEKIRSLGQLLAAEISNLTSRFRLGLGVFVDKPLAPYIDTLPQMIAHPDPNNPNSVPTFGYKNLLSLDGDPLHFQAAIEGLNSSGNIDNPEGGLDALLQVAVCEKQIGWKNKEDARRVVVLTTDAYFHYAGDGLLGGVVIPNDGLCHLEGQDYVSSTTMDYPSPGLVREVLLESQVVPIFAVTTNEKPLYEELAKFLGEETYAETGELKSDSSNIVRVIGEAYRKIAKTVTVRDDHSDGLIVNYTAVCSNGQIFENTRTCTGVELGETVSFRVSVSIENCSTDLPTNFSIKTPYGQVNMKLSYICGCECEQKGQEELKSPKCNDNGSLKCGVCHCEEEWAGEHCTCRLEDERRGCPSDGGEVCSGQGDCSCGKCYCKDAKDPRGQIYGVACECDNLSCPKDPDNQEICGGLERGTCECGQCNCTGNWTGPWCSCSTNLQGCIKNGVICSDRGTCRCGACACNASLPYRGPFCDECPSCIGNCEANRACVQCRLFGSGEMAGEKCSLNCGDFQITTVDELTPSMGKQCRFLDEEDCYFAFAYTVDADEQLKIFARKSKDCPSEMKALAIIVSVIGAVLAVALALLLIWRVLATIQLLKGSDLEREIRDAKRAVFHQDRRAFAKFEKEQHNAKCVMAENPIFQPTTTTFQNPMYGVQT